MYMILLYWIIISARSIFDTCLIKISIEKKKKELWIKKNWNLISNHKTSPPLWYSSDHLSWRVTKWFIDFLYRLKKVFFSWRCRSRATVPLYNVLVEKKNNRVTILHVQERRISFFSLSLSSSLLFLFFCKFFYREKSNAIPGQVITFPLVYMMARLKQWQLQIWTRNDFITQVLQRESLFFPLFRDIVIVYLEDYSMN